MQMPVAAIRLRQQQKYIRERLSYMDFLFDILFEIGEFFLYMCTGKRKKSAQNRKFLQKAEIALAFRGALR